MAALIDDAPLSFGLVAEDDVDPRTPVDMEPITPVWTREPAELARDGTISYDRIADTLFIRGSADHGGSISVQIDGWRFVRVDRTSHEVVGLQMESFLSRAVVDVPVLFTLLDRAEIRGITRAEIRQLRRGVYQRVGEEAVAKAGARLIDLAFRWNRTWVRIAEGVGLTRSFGSVPVLAGIVMRWHLGSLTATYYRHYDRHPAHF